MELNSTSTAKYKLAYHIVFCPKYRHPVLTGAVEVECQRIIAQACVTYGWRIVELNVMPDHVHLLVEADPSTAPSTIAATLKSISAVHLFATFKDLKRRKFWGSGLWSPATYYGSVGEANAETVRAYVANQKVGHGNSKDS